MSGYSSIGILQGAEHHYLLDVVMVACIPKMFDSFFDRGLGKHSIGFVIDNGSHQTSVDVETWHVLDLDPVVFV